MTPLVRSSMQEDIAGIRQGGCLLEPSLLETNKMDTLGLALLGDKMSLTHDSEAGGAGGTASGALLSIEQSEDIISHADKLNESG